MFWFIVKGGPVMIPIILGSILGLAIIIEKLWELYRIRFDAEAFSEKIFALVREGSYDEASAECARNSRYPIAAVLKSGLDKKHLGAQEMERVLERAGTAQIKELERHIGGLISIIGVEPLLGFLGTITGLIRAFMSWEKAGANVTVSALASGIYEAMITTAAGLIIAAPYYLIGNFIISRIKYESYELSDLSMRLVETVSESKAKR